MAQRPPARPNRADLLPLFLGVGPKLFQNGRLIRRDILLTLRCRVACPFLRGRCRIVEFGPKEISISRRQTRVGELSAVEGIGVVKPLAVATADEVVAKSQPEQRAGSAVDWEVHSGDRAVDGYARRHAHQLLAPALVLV